MKRDLRHFLVRVRSCNLPLAPRLSPFLSRSNELTIFYTFILSNFNYCPLAWHFCSENNSRKLQNIQERFVYEDFDFLRRTFGQRNIPTLHVRRHRTMALETLKILNNMSPAVLSNSVRLKKKSVYHFRYNNILQVPRVRTSNSIRSVSAMQ